MKAKTVPASAIESIKLVVVNITINATKNNPSTRGLKIENVVTSKRPASKKTLLTVSYLSSIAFSPP